MDGTLKATVNTNSATNRSRIIVWQASIPSGTHKVKVVNSATKGHPRIDLDAVRARVEEQFGPGALDQQPPAPARGLRGRLRRSRRRRSRRPQDCGGHIPFSRSAKKALELALRESIGLGQREIRLEHLTLGLMRADGLASTVVTRLGSSPQQVRRAVLDELGRAA